MTFHAPGRLGIKDDQQDPGILAQDLARLQVEMRRLDPPYAPGTAAQYASALRVYARRSGNPVPDMPPGPRMRAPKRRDSWRWIDGAAHRWPSLQVAATLCGLDDTELIAEALELYAEKQRGKAKQTLLTAAREARRLGEDDA